MTVRLDEMNQWLKVRTPAEVFKKCLRCKKTDLFEFEGEVFCRKCGWDSVIIHADALAYALLRKQKARVAKVIADLVPPSSLSIYAKLLLQSSSCEGATLGIPCPEVA